MSASWCLGVLAGGFSRRMGRDKASLQVQGGNLLEHAIERYAGPRIPVLVGTRPDGPGSSVPHPVCFDLLPGAGPLSSLAALLAAAPAPWLLAVPVDLPLLPSDLGERLLERSRGERALHLDVGERSQPFPMLLRRDDAASARALLQAGERRAIALLKALQARRIPFAEIWPEADPEVAFLNVNTPADLTRLRALLAS